MKLDGLFDELVRRGGSALHLGAGSPPLARIRGELVALRDEPIEGKSLEPTLLALLTVEQRTRLKSALDLHFAHAPSGGARFRVTYFHKTSGLGAVFRLVPSSVSTLAELACPEVLSRLADRRGGLVLVSGPPASGKSTTVAAMLDHVNKTRPCHVLTIEDPIEVVYEPLRAQITQREVGAHAPSYAAAVRSAVREDPDVLFVAELDTAETARLALELATQGVLVFATLPTSGATATLERLAGLFPAAEQPRVRGMLAESLVASISQQLVPTSDAKARVAAHEILLGTSAVSALIREARDGQLLDVMRAGQAQGMQSLDMALEALFSQGRIVAEDALERAEDREAFALLVARAVPALADPPG